MASVMELRALSRPVRLARLTAASVVIAFVKRVKTASIVLPTAPRWRDHHVEMEHVMPDPVRRARIAHRTVPDRFLASSGIASAVV